MEGCDAVVYKGVVLSPSLPFILLNFGSVLSLFRLLEKFSGKVKLI